MQSASKRLYNLEALRYAYVCLALYVDIHNLSTLCWLVLKHPAAPSCLQIMLNKRTIRQSYLFLLEIN